MHMNTSQVVSNPPIQVNQYYLCLKGRQPVAWNPQDDSHSVTLDYNSQYLYGIFKFVENHINEKDLTFYITRDLEKLPSYGEKVIAVVIGDEWGRIPAYACKVRMVFKCYGTGTILGCNPILHPSFLNIMTLARFLNAYSRYLLSAAVHFLQRAKGYVSGDRRKPLIYGIPVGYAKQIALPTKAIGDRTIDIFFDGSVVHKVYPFFSLKRWLGNPKLIARQTMLDFASQLKEKYPNINVELTKTTGFHDTTVDDSLRFSQNMMNAKICLVPRGTTFETCRLYEAIRYGCIVISEVLPSQWYLDQIPAFQLNDWSELESIAIPLLEDKELVQRKHQEALDWWEKTCSETAIGEFIVTKINAFHAHGVSS